MSTILEQIVASKRAEISAAKTQCPFRELRAAVADVPPPHDFLAAVRAVKDVALIAEIKKASPSRGVIRADFQPLDIARIYTQHGAACISVLTDAPFFQGHLDVLRQVRAVTPLPLLRKDFILDPYQIYEARAAGADAVLLIAECLPQTELEDLYGTTRKLGMTALVELYDDHNLVRVVDCGARLIGVNNRDLRSFKIDLQHTVRMRARIPADRILVGESGIHSAIDVEQLRQARVDAILVGEHLMAAADIGAAVDELVGR